MGIEVRIHPHMSVRITFPGERQEGEEEVVVGVEGVEGVGESGNMMEGLQGRKLGDRELVLVGALA